MGSFADPILQVPDKCCPIHTFFSIQSSRESSVNRSSDVGDIMWSIISSNDGWFIMPNAIWTASLSRARSRLLLKYLQSIEGWMLGSLVVNVISPDPSANSSIHVSRMPSSAKGSPPRGVEKDDGNICMSLRSSDPVAVYLSNVCIRGARGSKGKLSLVLARIATRGWSLRFCPTPGISLITGIACVFNRSAGPIPDSISICGEPIAPADNII